jgi:hypothetical protein
VNSGRCILISLLCICSLKQVRAKVWRLRTASDLFNVQTYTANLERVYQQMWERYEKGEDIAHLTELAEPYN